MQGDDSERERSDADVDANGGGNVWATAARRFRQEMARRGIETLEREIPLWTRSDQEDPESSWLLQNESYRLFDALGTNEIVHTRFLAAVIEAARQHSTEFATATCTALLGKQPPGRLVRHVLEVSLDTKSRVDFVLYLENATGEIEVPVPVEVKIDSLESGDQLARYAECSKEQGLFGIYLTRSGTSPSDGFFEARSWKEFGEALLQAGLPTTLVDRPVVEAFLRYCVASLGGGADAAMAALRDWAPYLRDTDTIATPPTTTWFIRGEALAGNLNAFVNAVHEGTSEVASNSMEGAHGLHDRLDRVLRRGFDAWWSETQDEANRWELSRCGFGPADFTLDSPCFRLYIQTRLDWSNSQPVWIVRLGLGSGGKIMPWEANRKQRRQVFDRATRAGFSWSPVDPLDRKFGSGWSPLSWKIPTAAPDLFTAIQMALGVLMSVLEGIDADVFGNIREPTQD